MRIDVSDVFFFGVEEEFVVVVICINRWDRRRFILFKCFFLKLKVSSFYRVELSSNLKRLWAARGLYMWLRVLINLGVLVIRKNFFWLLV